MQVCCSGRVAAVSTVVPVVVHASAVCTIAVAVGVIVTVMYPLCKHGMTVVIATDNVDMTRTLIIYCLCHCCFCFSVISVPRYLQPFLLKLCCFLPLREFMLSFLWWEALHHQVSHK